MPILKYTTSIDASKTVMEIQIALAKAGAKSVNIDYDSGGQPESVSFLISVQGKWVNFRLPSSYTGVLKMLENDPSVPKKLKTIDQARRVAWRITKDWTLAQMAIIEARQAELAEVFMPYAITASGQTLFQAFREGQLSLGSGVENGDDLGRGVI